MDIFSGLFSAAMNSGIFKSCYSGILGSNGEGSSISFSTPQKICFAIGEGFTNKASSAARYSFYGIFTPGSGNYLTAHNGEKCFGYPDKQINIINIATVLFASNGLSLQCQTANSFFTYITFGL